MPESAVVLLRASPQQYDQPHERKVDEIKENFTFAEHCNLDAEITALLITVYIIINCDAHDDYKYYIDNAEELSGNSIQNWMLSVISVNNLITESKGVHDRILLESVPSNGRSLASSSKP